MVGADTEPKNTIPETTMRIASVLTPINDHNLRLAAQIGVTDIVGRYPGAALADLLRLQEQIAAAGLTLSIIEGYVPHTAIVHGAAERDEQVAGFKQLIENMGQAGVPILCYNFMPNDDWARTSWRAPGRGGALVSTFDASEAEHWPPDPRGTIEADAIWRHLAAFLDEVVPVAEANNVVLALHPDDPPTPRLCGQARVLYEVAAFDRLLNLNTSPANGLCFCQGCFAQIGVDIPATIRHFGERIHYVHFRDVTGSMPCFRETFHDNGKTDMFAAIEAYHDIGFTGPMRPDHVPQLAGEEDFEFPGYSMMGRLYAVGYMKGLIDAVR
jgi:mannonate dehydratase